MRVALICPRLRSPKTRLTLFDPLGLVYLAQVAVSRGHDAHILDQAHPCLSSDRAMVESLGHLEPDLVGFTCVTAEYDRCVAMARRLKTASPDVKIAFGGYHVSTDPTAIEEEAIDFVVRGEGEHAFGRLLDALEGKGELSQIDGLSFKRDGVAVRNPRGERIVDLEALGIPSRAILPSGVYRIFGIADSPPRKQRFHSLGSSRGCPFSCTFCQTPSVRGHRYAIRPVAHVIEEIRGLIEGHQANFLSFVDEDFTCSPRRVRELCDGMLSSGIDIAWCTTARATDLDPELTHLMRRAGCRLVNVGVESGSDDTLQRSQKATTTHAVREAVKWLVEADIQVLGSAIVGFPWDSAARLDACLNFYRTLPLDVLGLGFCVPFRGTGLHEQAMAEGLIFDHDLSHWDTARPVMRTHELGPGELSRYFDRINRAFYRSPYFWQRMARSVARRPVRALSLIESAVGSALDGGLRARFATARRLERS